MASFTSHDAFNRYCTSLYKFRIPLCKNNGQVDYQASFVSSSGSEDAKNLCSNLNAARKQLLIELASASPSQNLRLSCIDAYLPLLSILISSLNSQPPVTIERQLSFEWYGAFANGPTVVYSQSHELIFELSMVLHTKAVIHYLYAYELLQGDIGTNLQVAGQNLRTAAGILRYMANVLLPKWAAGPQGKGSRPPEVDEAVCLAYAELFTASAQQMAFVKALTKIGGSPPGILCKVGIGVVSIITGNYDPVRLLPEVKHHYSVLREFYKGLAYRYQAEISSMNNDKGIAIGYCNESLRHLQVQSGKTYQIAVVGLPSDSNKAHAAPGNLKAALAVLVAEVEGIKVAAEKENKIIYFSAVPAFDDLPPLPAAALIMQPTEFIPTELPATGPVMFVYNPALKPSLLTKMGSTFGLI
jgi:hypothetical protein